MLVSGANVVIQCFYRYTPFKVIKNRTHTLNLHAIQLLMLYSEELTHLKRP